MAHVDRFGNVALDLQAADLPGSRQAWTVDTPAGPVARWVDTFGELSADAAGLLVNSTGEVEIVVRDGRADDRFALDPSGDVVLRRT